MSNMDLLMQTDQENARFVPQTENSNGSEAITPNEENLSGSGGTVKRSASLGALALALAKAQLDFETVTKGTENPFYKSRYADLSAIIAATQKSLARNGLVIIQSPIVDVAKQQAGVTSLMVHSSGEWISSELILPATMLGRDGRPRFDSQACGSAQTYARRYAYQALIGVAAEPDDDANKSVGIGTHEAAQAVAKEKIAALRESGQPLSGNPDAVPTLTYEWNNDNQTAKIDGPEILLKLHKPYLKQFWSPSARAIVVNGEQLENLKFEMDKRNTPFKLKELARG